MQLGAEVVVARNDALDLDKLDYQSFKGIVISPGPGTPEEAGVTMKLIKRVYGRIPLFGVCLGMQALALHFGGKVTRAEYPMHGKVSEIKLTNHPMFEGLESLLKVCRYHSLVVDIQQLTNIKAIAYSSLNEVMALADKKNVAWGVQFHPEAILSEGGKTIIANWLKHINLQPINTKQNIH